MNRLATDRDYLQYQYGSTEKLKIRQETHRLYSERNDKFMPWVLDMLEPSPGDRLADIGCGPGAYFNAIAKRNSGASLSVLGIDMSTAMLTEAGQRGAAAGITLSTLQADTQFLPLANDCCQRVMANHILYHVPDQVAALSEMARILTPGGRIVLVTNAADASQVLEDAHEEAAHKLGLTCPVGLDERFSLDHLNLVQSVFPNASVVIREDAFLFPDSASALRYYATGMIDRVEPLPADGSHRANLLPLVAARLDAIIAEQDQLRVPKNSGCFVADMD
jgi:ubiquinone/menaquinone biosynthesis C-methylase UbiE